MTASASVIKYVNAYAVTRHLGGREEGGWWYDAGSPLASVPIRATSNKDNAVVAEKARLEEIFEDVNEGDISSVLGGTRLDVYIEDEAAEYFPQERPYYE